MRTHKKSSNRVRTPLQKEEIDKLISKQNTKLWTSRKENNQCSNNTEILKELTGTLHREKNYCAGVSSVYSR